MNDYIIAEEYTLPSKGLVYSQEVNPNIKIRSMTTNEEMKRLSPSERPYKLLSEIIDDCLVVKPGISSYDMCLEDFQYLLHKLRVVTYGSDYKLTTVCPVCGNINNQKLDLDTLPVSEYSDECNQNLNITLPATKKVIKLKLQTPRILDDISVKSKDLHTKSPDMKGEPAFLLNLQSLIDTVDGEKLNTAQLTAFVSQLPMRDANYILKSINKIKLGIDTMITFTCQKCKANYNQSLPITGEFFRPSID